MSKRAGMKLSDEQIEKAAKAMHMAGPEPCSWDAGGDYFRNKYRRMATVAAPLLQEQPAQPETQPAPDVVQKMRQAYSEVDGIHVHGNTLNMTAAAQVLLDEALAPMTNEEARRFKELSPMACFNWTMTERRARLAAKPPQQEPQSGCNNSSGLSQVNVPQCTTPTIPEWEKALFEEWCDKGSRVHYDKLIKGIRARLAAKPPQQETQEQQVTAILQETVKETNEQWEAAAEKIARVREGK